jgi:hypothetical protein
LVFEVEFVVVWSVLPTFRSDLPLPELVIELVVVPLLLDEPPVLDWAKARPADKTIALAFAQIEVPR